MRGRILGFTPSSRTGTITADDGRRYGFTRREWRSDHAIAPGLDVDFDVRGEEAVGVYPLGPKTRSGGLLGWWRSLSKALSNSPGRSEP